MCFSRIHQNKLHFVQHLVTIYFLLKRKIEIQYFQTHLDGRIVVTELV